MADQPLRVVGITIGRSASVSDVARGIPPRLNLTVEVENQGQSPLFVWAECRARSYDASKHVLTVQLAEPVIERPPHIKIISDHPRVPTQVEVEAKSRTKIKLRLPGTVRRLTPGQGLGRSFVDEPVGPIDRVEIRLQYATEPIQNQPGEVSTDLRKRLKAHGDVLQASIEPIAEK
jgi:hypothetical protein